MRCKYGIEALSQLWQVIAFNCVDGNAGHLGVPDLLRLSMVIVLSREQEVALLDVRGNFQSDSSFPGGLLELGAVYAEKIYLGRFPL